MLSNLSTYLAWPMKVPSLRSPRRVLSMNDSVRLQ